jgi:hypothetical protein
VVGNLAYVADNLSGLRVIDVSNPAAPVEVGAFATPDVAQDVEVVGDLAYVSANSAGLRVIDVSNPTSPVELGAAVVTGGIARDIEVAGDLAYVARHVAASLHIIDFGPEYAVPEPGSSLMLAVGVGVLVALRRVSRRG